MMFPSILVADVTVSLSSKTTDQDDLLRPCRAKRTAPGSKAQAAINGWLDERFASASRPHCLRLLPDDEHRNLAINWFRVSLKRKRDVKERCSGGVQERFESCVNRSILILFLAMVCQDCR
jgi:hypothetical protein